MAYILFSSMATYSLTAYRLRIKQRRKSDYMSMDNVDGQGTDFFDVLVSFFRYLQKLELNTNESKKEGCRLSFPPIAERRRIYGFIEGGEYGIRENGFNTKTRQASYTKTTDDISLKPFYFSLQVQKNSLDTIVILQRFRTQGIKTMLLGLLTTWLRQNYPGLTVEVEYLLPGGYAQRLIESHPIKKVTFFKYDVPKDITDHYSDLSDSTGARTELSIIAQRRGHLGLVNQFRKLFDRDSQRTVKNLFAFSEEIRGFEYDNIKVTISESGRQRTIDLSNVLNIRSDFDIDNVPRNDDGHLVLEAVDAYAEEMCREFRVSMNQDNPEDLVQDKVIDFQEPDANAL